MCGIPENVPRFLNIVFRDFPRPHFGAEYLPLPNDKNEQKLPRMKFIIPNFLVLRFGENFMKIGTKIPKLHIHEFLHVFIHIFIKFS